jgi:hypothetical protein
LGNKVFPRIRQRQWNYTLGQQILVLGLADVYYNGGNMKKANFHYEVAAMAGHEVAQLHRQELPRSLPQIVPSP